MNGGVKILNGLYCPKISEAQNTYIDVIIKEK
jgi:hypothetical protein